MFTYIKNNKNWIFSGIGVLAISLVISNINVFSKKEPEIQEENDKMPEINKSNTNINLITPREIISSIDKLPPLQQEDAAKAYIGIKVTWDLEFYSARKDIGESKKTNEYIIRVMLQEKNNNYITTSVFCKNVRLSEYPEFKIMKPGKLLKVKGTISDVDKTYIDIKDAKFSY